MGTKTRVLIWDENDPHVPGDVYPEGIRGVDPTGPIGPAGQGRGAGRVFYFRPGHETVPTYFDERVKRVLFNIALWAAGG